MSNDLARGEILNNMKNYNHPAVENVFLLDEEEVGYTASPCEMGLEPHEFEITDFSGSGEVGTVYLKCVRCGKIKRN